MTIPVFLAQENANDTAAVLIDWLAKPGSRVEPGQPLAVFETTKATYEIESPGAGWLVALAQAGEQIDIGHPFAELRRQPPQAAAAARPAQAERKITRKARLLMERHGLEESRLPAGLALVREQDVLKLIGPAAPADAPDGLADIDAILEDPDCRRLMDSLDGLRRRMQAKHARHVPTGTLLNDRWKLAAELGFGQGSSVYDECLLLGDVKVGANCWIGPYTVLDGSGGGLEVGDWTDIGSGAHLYTHHSIDRALTGGAAQPFYAPTRIGRCCFIGPMSMIAPGTEIGDHSFVAAFSYVEGRFPPYSYIAGTPARVIGRIEIKNGRAVRRLFDQQTEPGADER